MGHNVDSTTARAREQRATLNPAQRSLWSVLRARQLGGWKFTRQMPIGPYFADFVCRERCVIVEVDGSLHLERAAFDRARDEYMMAAGYSVYRVPAASVLKERHAVCASLLAVLENRIEDFVESPNITSSRSVAATRNFNVSNAIRRRAS
jgi:very-short-patch-repair endonuclease